MVIAWLNSLCPRLHHLLQVGFGKEFSYDFSLAQEATRNSIEMLKRGIVDHYRPLHSSAKAEVVAFSSLREGDESALLTMVDAWKYSPGHSWDLSTNNSLGIGFSYDSNKELIYATVRLGD